MKENKEKFLELIKDAANMSRDGNVPKIYSNEDFSNVLEIFAEVIGKKIEYHLLVVCSIDSKEWSRLAGKSVIELKTFIKRYAGLDVDNLRNVSGPSKENEKK
jgi:hypothetical protein